MSSANDVRLDVLGAVGEHADRGAVLRPVQGEPSATAEVTSGSLGDRTDPDVGVTPHVLRGVSLTFRVRVVSGATDANLVHLEHLRRGVSRSVQNGVGRETDTTQTVLELGRGANQRPNRIRNHDAQVRGAFAVRQQPVDGKLNVISNVERRQIRRGVSRRAVRRGEVRRVERLSGNADFVSEQQLAAGELGGDHLGVEETRDVRGHRIVNSLFDAVLLSEKALVVVRAG